MPKLPQKPEINPNNPLRPVHHLTGRPPLRPNLTQIPRLEMPHPQRPPKLLLPTVHPPHLLRMLNVRFTQRPPNLTTKISLRQEMRENQITTIVYQEAHEGEIGDTERYTAEEWGVEEGEG